MSKLIVQALMLEAQAKEAKALANLQNYMSNAAGIGEHPDVVEECSKLVKEIAEAKEMAETLKTIVQDEGSDNR
tara:strand:+ start:23 stop:244 length:222 start_codon:yes stop_codon:yes gene_type:complete